MRFQYRFREAFPTTLTSQIASLSTFTLQEDINVSIGTGFTTHLKKGTTWRKVGTIQQGDVLATRDQVVTVEASHIHEAQIVVEGGKIVGFYLLVERTFAPAATPVTLTFRPQH